MNKIVLSQLTCINENIDLDQYIEIREMVRKNMEHPEWLGDMKKEDLVSLLNNNAKIWLYYEDNNPVCSMMMLPCHKKDIEKFEVNYNNEEVIDYGPIFVCKDYIGNHLQYQMLQELDKYCISKGFKYAISTIHPDNIYSINNFVKDNFKLHKTKELKRGIRNIYIKKY